MRRKQPHTKLHKATLAPLPPLSPPSVVPTKAPPLWLARLLAWDATEILPPLFLALGGLLGLLFAVLMPPLQIPDEPAHFYRAFAISNGACVSPADQAVPLALQQLSAIFPNRVETHHPVRFQDYKRLMGTRWMDGGLIHIQLPGLPRGANVNASIYNCAPYLASAAGVELAKLTSQSAIILFYSARLANLALYLLAVYVALRILPFGRPVLFCLALMPMTLHQAASVSADAATIASAFLLFAYVLYLAFDPRIVAVSGRHLIALGGLLLFTTLCKFNPWFILLLLLIPSSKFGTTRRKLLTAGAFLALVLLAAVAWQSIDRANILAFKAGKANLGIDTDGNLAFILHHPLRFLAIFAHSCWLFWNDYATEFVGYFGWISFPLPAWLVKAYLGLLIAAALVSETRVRITLKDRLIGAGIVAGSTVSIFALLWAFETPQSYLATEIIGLGPRVNPGIQGRYFIPFAPILLMAISSTRLRLPSLPVVAACLGMVLIADGVALASIHRAYYDARNRVYYDPDPAAALASIHPVYNFGDQRGLGRAGLYKNGLWILDIDGSHQFDAADPGSRASVAFGGLPGDLPVLGDWNGDGRRKVGIYRHGVWMLDWDGDGRFTSADRVFIFGGLPGDLPVVGDWTGDGHAKIGVYRSGAWILDLNGNGIFEPGLDSVLYFGGLPIDIPVVGHWAGSGRRDEIGIYRQGTWLLDSNGNGQFEDSDTIIHFGGLPGDVPVVGDWTGDGKPRLGLVRGGSAWFLDLTGDHQLRPGPANFSFGSKDYIPLVGPWAPLY
jgi:hypothetical protein